MKISPSTLSILGILFIAGCTASNIEILTKAQPAAIAFLSQYPNAKITTNLVSEGTVLAQINEIEKDCEDFPTASYYKSKLIDEASGTNLIVWIDSKTYQVVCIIKESGGVKTPVQNVPTTTAALITTTTSNITTTTVCATTTTTLPPTTTTTSAAATTTTTINTTTTSSTTTTQSNLPDLNISEIDFDRTTYANTPTLNLAVKNIGMVDAGPFNLSVMFSNSKNIDSQYASLPSLNSSYRINGLAVGSSINVRFNVTSIVNYPNCGWHVYNTTADSLNEISESNENNNKFVTGYFRCWAATSSSSLIFAGTS